jgi:hypothetical protein
LDRARASGDRRGAGTTLGNLGSAYAALGEAARAIGYCEQALPVLQAIGDRQGEAICCWNLGEKLEKQDALARAVALMQGLVDFYRELGHPRTEERTAELARVRPRRAGGRRRGRGGRVSWSGWSGGHSPRPSLAPPAAPVRGAEWRVAR